ncbi:MAG TPA: CHAD domain-containing protein [Solirubrobacteraceae bacterium]|nr:CHAD domain-containing protein [Solirubrobacteraceae bacterium]
MAATVAVGVGVVLARAERERRNERQRRLDSELALCPGEGLAEGLRRMALGQVDLAVEKLGGAGEGVAGEEAVHDTRKALKRLRALVRLLRDELGASAFAREDDALAQLGGRLAGARDSEVMLGTLEELVRRNPHELGRRKGVARLRRRLAAEHDWMERKVLGDPLVRGEVLAGLQAVRATMAAWSLPDDGEIGLVEPGLRRIYRQGRARYRRVAHGRGDRMATMHQWRKRVKDLRYATEMLDRRDQIAGRDNGRAHGRSTRGGDAERLRRLARRADALGELLGEDHDLALLAELVRAAGKRRGALGVRIGRGSRRALLKAIARRQRRLRRDAMRQGERLYRSPPKQFIRGVRAAYLSG